MSSSPVLDYIRANWARSVYLDAPGKGFGGVDLPFPYTSPCIRDEGHFFFFFYWDTYFTNLGLLRHGLLDVARDNIRNMLWLIARQGYMPNHVGLYNRSQPPYLAWMVRDYFAATGDEAFLREAAAGVRQEYHFWTTARHTPTGLQRHGHHETSDGLREFYRRFVGKRLGLPEPESPEEEIRRGGHFMAEAETGWDFNPRFDSRCLDFNPVDLNALLYGVEIWLAEIAPRLGWNDQELWKKRAGQRRERMQRFLWDDERGLFLDYDHVNGRRSAVASVATFMPLFTDLATPEQAARIVSNLPLFERAHGLAVTEDAPFGRGYQWAFPNSWPPLVYVAAEGMRRYGYEAEAGRVAEAYLATADRLFARTGRLWEKIDAVSGEVAGGEYNAAAMLGWSAGVYVALEASRR